MDVHDALACVAGVCVCVGVHDVLACARLPSDLL